MGKLIIHHSRYLLSEDREYWIDLFTGREFPCISGGSPMYNPHFDAFRFYDDDAGEAASAPLEAEDIDHSLMVDTDQNIQLRTLIQETEGVDGDVMDDFRLQSNKNLTSFANLSTTDPGTGIKAVDAGLTDTNATTNRSTNGITDGSGSFVAGEQCTDGFLEGDPFALTASNFTEHVYGIGFVAANVSNGDTFDFQFIGSSLVNNIVPRITIVKAAAGGFGLALSDHWNHTVLRY